MKACTVTGGTFGANCTPAAPAVAGAGLRAHAPSPAPHATHLPTPSRSTGTDVCTDECAGYSGDLGDGYTYRYYVLGPFNSGTCGMAPIGNSAFSSFAEYHPFTPPCLKGCCPQGAECSFAGVSLPTCGADAQTGISGSFHGASLSTLPLMRSAVPSSQDPTANNVCCDVGLSNGLCYMTSSTDPALPFGNQASCPSSCTYSTASFFTPWPLPPPSPVTPPPFPPGRAPAPPPPPPVPRPPPPPVFSVPAPPPNDATASAAGAIVGAIMGVMCGCCIIGGIFIVMMKKKQGAVAPQ